MVLHSILLSMILAFQLSNDTAAINGSVAIQNDMPAEGAMVLLITESYSTVLIWTGQDGKFAFTNIDPGRYTVIVFQYGFVPWAWNYLTVEEGETATLDIVLTPASAKDFSIKYMKPRQKDLDSFASALDAFKEPHFCSNAIISDEHESYRFLYLRSFHPPVLIHLEYDSNNASVTHKELDSNGDVKLGSLSEVKEFDLYKKFIEDGMPIELHKLVLEGVSERAQEYFWEQPYKIDSGIIGVDGATWTIEGVKDGKCHVVTRWSPGRPDPIRIFADSLIQISGKRLYYDEVY